jgi:plastocyanin
MEPETTQQQPTPMSMTPKRNIAKTAIIAVAVMALIGAVTGGVLLTQKEANNQTSAAALPSAQVAVRAGGEFSPQAIKIKKGQAVTWTNTDGFSHRIAPFADGQTDTAAGLGSSQPLEEGAAYTYTFEQTGMFTYYDALSAGRSAGTVIVTE